MGEAKRKRKTNGSTVEDLMNGQVHGTIDQSAIPPDLNVFANMEAAWQELTTWFCDGLPLKQQQDAKFIFFNGVQAAANLMMYCEGQNMFEAAADQLQADCIAYEKEAEQVLKERQANDWRMRDI